MTRTILRTTHAVAAHATVARSLLAAAYRERVGRARLHDGRLWLGPDSYPARRFGFDRLVLSGVVEADLPELVSRLNVDGDGLAAELASSRENLTIGYARRADIDEALRATGAPDLVTLASDLPADEQALLFERICTEGHNLHPCARTRLGWSTVDALAHDLESPGTTVGLVAVRRGIHGGDDVGAVLRDAYPELPAPPKGYVAQPVHAWQLSTVVRQRYADLIAAGDLRVMDGSLTASPTCALRTVLLQPDVDGVRRYLKLSLDIQVTSTRRTISMASARNGPYVSALLHRLATGSAAGQRVLLLHEVAGAAVDAGPGRGRDLTAIVRGGLGERLAPDEVAVPATALFAHSPLTGGTVLAELLAHYRAGPLEFLHEYAELLLVPVVAFARAGVGLEAHLQNSIPTFVRGAPHRLVLRDFAGLRLHLPRLRQWCSPRLWPGSVITTDDVDVLRAKVGYTTLQAHLGELVLRLVVDHGVDEAAAWRVVRGVLGRAGAEPSDRACWTAPFVAHKALLTMRLTGGGDRYVPVPNPLHGH